MNILPALDTQSQGPRPNKGPCINGKSGAAVPTLRCFLLQAQIVDQKAKGAIG